MINTVETDDIAKKDFCKVRVKAQENIYEAGIYVVSTPIGNLNDITFRAVDVLSASDYIICEDTRVSRKLLSALSIGTKTYSYHDHNAEKMRPKIYDSVERGKRVAFICDAGTPLISDPGFKLIKEAIEKGISVVPIPGVSAPITALMVAGLPCDVFTFFGFLPHKRNERENILRNLKQNMGTVVFFESPNRLRNTVNHLAMTHPDAHIVIARELTKKFEHFLRGTAQEIQNTIDQIPKKGEIVLLVRVKDIPPCQRTVDAMLLEALKTMKVKDAATAVAQKTYRRNRDMYARALKLSEENISK